MAFYTRMCLSTLLHAAAENPRLMSWCMFNARPSIPMHHQPPRLVQHTIVRAGSFNLDGESVQKPAGRPSKLASKRNADASVKLTRSMCDLTERQLATVLPVLEPYIANELLVARGIKKTNQARGRQEALVGRMIRSLPDDEQQRIKDTVDAALQGRPPPSPATDLATYWKEQLVADNKHVVDEVYRAAAEANIPVAEVRQLVKQCAAAAQQPAGTTPLRTDNTPNTPATPPDTATPGTKQPSREKQPSKAKARSANKQLLQLLGQVAQHKLDGDKLGGDK